MNAEPSNLYAVLGVPTQATQAQVDHAFRALLRRHHPDTREGGDEAQGVRDDAALQDVFAAHAVLGDPQLRRVYDGDVAISRRRTSRPPPRYQRSYGQPWMVVGPVQWQPSGRGAADPQ